MSIESFDESSPAFWSCLDDATRSSFDLRCLGRCWSLKLRGFRRFCKLLTRLSGAVRGFAVRYRLQVFTTPSASPTGRSPTASDGRFAIRNVLEPFAAGAE